MRLGTIWTVPAMSLQERVHRTIEWGWATAAHRLPRRLAYWSLIDTGVRHIRSNEVVPEVEFTTILERAGKALR